MLLVIVKMKWNRCYLFTLLAIWLLAACKPKVPSQVIQPDDMEEVLYDYYLAHGMSIKPGEEGDRYNREYYHRLALKKHGYTQADFDSPHTCPGGLRPRTPGPHLSAF